MAQAFKEKFGIPYAINGGKEGRIIKALLKVHPPDRLKEFSRAFFQSKDPSFKNRVSRSEFSLPK
jgi:hypothetical protein